MTDYERPSTSDVDTVTQPSLTGAEIKEWRERFGLTLVEMMHVLGYSSGSTRRLRERMFEYETDVKPLPASQVRLILAYGCLVFQGLAVDPIDDLLDHGDFFP